MNATKQTAHTPGPWITDSNGNIWGPKHERSRFKNGRQCIALVVDEKAHNDPSISNGRLDEEGAANAQLLAAAPDMLAACETVGRELNAAIHAKILGGTWSALATMLNDAAAKATGKSWQ